MILSVDAFPRCLGFPRQSLVNDRTEAMLLVDQNNGVAPCYASHNWFPTSENGVPKTVLYEWMVFDFDSDDISGPLDDARRLAGVAMRLNVPFLCRFSGSHGFHIYLRFAPKHLQINPGAARLVAAIQNWFIEQAEAKTADPHVIGDLRRLMRIPQTAWAKEKNGQVMVNGLYCITISPHELMTCSTDEILNMASTPRPTPSDASPDQTAITITDFVQSYEIDVEKYSRLRTTSPHTFMPYSQVSDTLLLELTQKPCVVAALCSTHPPHISKFHLVARLNKLGFSSPWVEGLIADLATRYSWDVYDIGTTHEQVEGIYRNAYKFPSCGTIKTKGGCMGSACPKFRESCA